MEIAFGVLIIFMALLLMIYFDNRKKYFQVLHDLSIKQNTDRFCKNCVRIYGYERQEQYVDQCEIPSCGLRPEGITDDSKFLITNFDIAVFGKPRYEELNYCQEGIDFLKSHLKHIIFCNGKENMIYGHPSSLNINHDCFFYKEEEKKEIKKFSIKERFKIFFKVVR